MHDKPRTQIKICCIATLEEARLAINAGADAVGFVGVDNSPRAMKLSTIAAITAQLNQDTATFFLTAESSAESIAQQVIAAGATTVQLASYLTVRELEKLRAVLPETKRVQVIHVENESALDLVAQNAPYVHSFLLDSGRPNQAKPEYGGTGRTHDWSISAEFVRRSPIPVMLAGGLSAENVGDAIRFVKPYAVDLCTGVRSNGQLDAPKLKAYIDAVRMVDAELRASV